MRTSETFFYPDEVSKQLGVSKSTLAKWRMSGSGPAYHRFGRRVRYSELDNSAWVSSKRVEKYNGMDRNQVEPDRFPSLRTKIVCSES